MFRLLIHTVAELMLCIFKKTCFSCKLLLVQNLTFSINWFAATRRLFAIVERVIRTTLVGGNDAVVIWGKSDFCCLNLLF